MHVLPAGFHRIRYGGFLAARGRREKLTRCRQLLGFTAVVTTPTDATRRTDYRDRVEPATGICLRVSPAWQHAETIIIERLLPASRAGFLNPDTS